ncbi:MerR family transcriptional regulator [Enterovirga rhinocerotis]|uniref:MerR-like DNA binding protein n=1 Tax=Enterovirga rhinocerotis TaxID=1339210 RepID=A0A4R7C6B1_9HYPH|nr:MerR family transcriptional regulator [Enterovirga rhinocerotis]TDR94114.1 MerR-like DNA binding protein [Enterovirga rhinocerotis]
MNKAPDAFRTISEVAEDLDIPQHVLRFWETRFSSIRPLKRGGGRRYYRPDDVDLLRGIRELLYGHGYTIKGVQRILKEDGPRAVQSVGRGGALPAARPEPDDADEFEPEAPAQHGLPLGPADVAVEDEMPPYRPEPPPAFLRPYLEPAPALSEEQTGRLRSVLGELQECQRILEAIKRG